MKTLKPLLERLVVVLCIVVAYRVGTSVPLPGADLGRMEALATDPVLSMWSLFSGGPVARASIFALGVTPYLTAALVMQLLEGIIPSLKRLKEEGLDGQRRKSRFTRMISIVIALVQAPIAAISLSRAPLSVVGTGWYVVLASAGLVAGYLVCLWLAEFSSRRGIGNGATVLMLCSISASVVPGFQHLRDVSGDSAVLAAIVAFVAVVIVGTVIHLTTRSIVVGWAKLTTMAPSKPTKLQFRLLLGGVVPIILASSLVGALVNVFSRISPDLASLLAKPAVSSLLLVILVSVLSIVYARMAYDGVEITNDLTRAGRYVVGLRPGWATVRYLHKTTVALAWWNAIVLVPVIYMPVLVRSAFGFALPGFIGTTTLILVSGLAEWSRQLRGLRTLDQKSDVELSIERAGHIAAIDAHQRNAA